MKTEQVVKDVLDMYIGSQLNIDSESARDILAKHITAELEFSKNNNQDETDGTPSDDLYI